MIIYNMRHRGAYEYDKFTLNVLQISNAVTLSELHELNANNADRDTLLKIQKEINETYDKLIGTDATIGLAEKLYLDSFMIKEGF